jgi:hypothetical protein
MVLLPPSAGSGSEISGVRGRAAIARIAELGPVVVG